MTRSVSVVVCLALLGCGPAAEEQAPPGEPATPALPDVTDQRADLVLTWFADGGPAVATSVSEVPRGARSRVRVQDPRVAPELRDPRWIFLADLTQKGPGGRYRVRAVPRGEYESERRKARAPLVAPQPASPSVGGGGGAVAKGDPTAPVIMYSTRHCPVCVKARRWLLEQRIQYVERDIERDQKAAAELHEKGRAQGVSTSGVPVFDVRGRLVPGFDPGAIVKLLTGGGQAANVI